MICLVNIKAQSAQVFIFTVEMKMTIILFIKILKGRQLWKLCPLLSLKVLN